MTATKKASSSSDLSKASSQSKLSSSGGSSTSNVPVWSHDLLVAFHVNFPVCHHTALWSEIQWLSPLLVSVVMKGSDLRLNRQFFFLNWMKNVVVDGATVESSSPSWPAVSLRN